MRQILMIVLVALAAALAGYLLGTRSGGPLSEPGGAARSGEREVLYWVAPMDPNFRRDAPGKSPMGMDLVPVYADAAAAQPGLVSIDPAVAANLGIRTAVAERGVLPRHVDTVGYVGFDETSVQHVHTRVDGWVERLSVAVEGDPVERGQVLFELYSPELVNAQREFLAALGSRSDALRAASAERLRALGLTADEIARLGRQRKVRERIPYRAERDGIVETLGARDGAYVTAATPIVSIASLDHVWVVAEVFERQADWVRAGQHAELTFDGLPGTVRHAAVEYIYPELDPRTRTLRVRLEIPNEGGQLRPGMLARVTIHGEAGDPVVHVPRQAVIRGGDVDRVVLALGDGAFRIAPVRVGIESGETAAILEGLSAGQRVVTSGQFLIDSEANVDSALLRFDAPDADDGRRNMGAMPTRGDGEDGGMDHAGHDMGGTDHEGHDMGEPAIESDGDRDDASHEGHDTGGTDHEGHDMSGPAIEGGDARLEGHDAVDVDHDGHGAGGAAVGRDGGMDDDDHTGHDMGGTGHEAQDAGSPGPAMESGDGADHSGHDTQHDDGSEPGA